MEPSWRAIFDELRAAQFADIEGAEVALRLPVSDRLLTNLIRPRLPPSIRAADFELKADPGNLLTVHVRLAQPAFLPLFKIRLRIESQPQLPASPILGLRVLSQGVVALAGPASRFFRLPPGIHLDGERLTVDLAALLERYGAAEALGYTSQVEVTTGDRQVIFTVRAALPRAGGPAGSSRSDVRA